MKKWEVRHTCTCKWTDRSCADLANFALCMHVDGDGMISNHRMRHISEVKNRVCNVAIKKHFKCCGRNVLILQATLAAGHQLPDPEPEWVKQPCSLILYHYTSIFFCFGTIGQIQRALCRRFLPFVQAGSLTEVQISRAESFSGSVTSIGKGYIRQESL